MIYQRIKDSLKYGFFHVLVKAISRLAIDHGHFLFIIAFLYALIDSFYVYRPLLIGLISFLSISFLWSYLNLSYSLVFL